VTDALDLLLQGEVAFGGGPPTIGYVLLGLAAERHPGALATDAMVRLLRLSQRRDGRWSGMYRPPISDAAPEPYDCDAMFAVPF
jgi:hypothetical protein